MKKITLFTALLLMAMVGKAQILEVKQCSQEQTNWCWAATAQCILKFYGDTTLRQCDIAEYTRSVAQSPPMNNYGSDDCCENPSGPCNQMNYMSALPGTLFDIVRHFGVPNVYKNNPLSFAEVRAEIEKGRPFALCVEWKGGGGHVVVAHGLVDSTLYYMDPWPTEGFKFSNYKEMLDNEAHTWTYTNIMSISPTPDPGVSIVQITDLQQQIKISPNPSGTGKFVVENLPTTGISYGVYTTNGQLIQQGKTFDATLQLSIQQKGIFMLKLWDKNGSITQKVVVN